MCKDFPDWSIAAAGSEASLRIGYEYGRFVTKEEQQIEPHLLEPDMHDQEATVPNQEATSAEVCSISDCTY